MSRSTLPWWGRISPRAYRWAVSTLAGATLAGFAALAGTIAGPGPGLDLTKPTYVALTVATGVTSAVFVFAYGLSLLRVRGTWVPYEVAERAEPATADSRLQHGTVGR